MKLQIIKILLLTRYDYLGASSRMRFLQFLPRFEHAAFRCTVAPFVDDVQLQRSYQKGGYGIFILPQIYCRRLWVLVRLRGYDVVWIEKEALPWLPAWLEIWLLRKVPFVLDYDDATFHGYDQHKAFWARYFFGRRIDRLMMSSELVIAGNAYLAQRARNAGTRSVEIIPTVIDLNRYTPKPMSKPNPSATDSLRIVWI